MSAGPQHRKLIDHLAEWDVDQVAELLRRRPDLARPNPPPDVAELASRAQHQPSVQAAIARANLAENRLLQVLVSLRRSVTDAELAQALPDGVHLADVEPVLASLEAAALAWRYGGRVHCSGTLRQCMPTALGPPLSHFERALTVAHLGHAIRLLRPVLGEARQTGELPPPAVGPDGRAPHKADLMEELSALLSMPGAAAAVVDAAPPAVADVIEALADEPLWVQVSHSLWFSPHGSRAAGIREPTYWMFERALLLPDGDHAATIPSELALSWRGGRPLADLGLAEPTLEVRAVDPAIVDERGAVQVVHLLDQAAELLDLWTEVPAKALQSGGLSVAGLKAAATRLDVDTDTAARLVELAHVGGLVDQSVVTTKVGRRATYSYVVETDAEVADPWRDRPPVVQWRQLVGAWQRAERWPSLAGRKVGDAKAIPALGYQYPTSSTAVGRRDAVLTALLALAPGEGVDPDGLAAHLFWHAPQAWRQATPGSTDEAIGWILEEAEVLGLVAEGALTSFGRLVLTGAVAAAEAALAATLPAAATSVTLQADLTAVLVGHLDRAATVELRLLADVESTGAATTLRFSEASLRRGFDAGRTPAQILEFLEARAAKGVPKPLAYLVADVARRHGHLQVGAAMSFLTSEDPAVLADAVSHRKARKLDLRLLAPTVAVSSVPVAKLVDGLREAGFLPVADGDATAAVALKAPKAKAKAADDELPERYRRAPRLTAFAAQLNERETADLAAGILEGGRGAARQFRMKGARR